MKKLDYFKKQYHIINALMDNMEKWPNSVNTIKFNLELIKEIVDECECKMCSSELKDIYWLIAECPIILNGEELYLNDIEKKFELEPLLTPIIEEYWERQGLGKGVK